MKIVQLSVPVGQRKMRLDQFIVEHLEKITREQVQTLIKNRLVEVDGAICTRNSTNIQGKKRIVVVIPYREEREILPESDIPVDILYEDVDIVVVHKPVGLVVHPAPGHWEGTLVNALYGRCERKQGFSESEKMRIGLIHRLDKNTSGVIVIAKHEEAKNFLSQQFKNRTVKKTYIAIVQGIIMPAEGLIDAPIGRDVRNRKKMAIVSERRGGKVAQTFYRTLYTLNNIYTVVEASPLTGRTHQLRVHFASLGYPLVGDSTYGQGDKNALHLEHQALHAWKLEITMMTGERKEFIAPLPEYFYFGEVKNS